MSTSKPTVAQSSAGGAKPAAAPKLAEAPKMPAFKIESPQQRGRYHKWFIYGNYGCGKTTLAGTACEVDNMRDVLLINAEAGDQSVADMDISVITVSTYKTLSKVKEYLSAHCKARDAGDIEKLRQMEGVLRGETLDDGVEPKKFQTVIIDTISEVESYCMYQLLGITDTTSLDEEVASPEWAEYKRSRSMMLRLIRGFRDLPMNVIFTCAEQYTQDETKKMKFAPQLTGRLSKDVQGFMDMVGYYQVGNARDDGSVPRRLSVIPSGKFDAKHRYPSFKGTHFDDPTVSKILDSIGFLKK